MDRSLINNNTRIIDLTVGELLDIIARERERRRLGTQAPKRNYEYGIHGIARIFNCSMTTANRIKKSGVINEAICQNGRVIVTDVDKALQLFNKNRV